MIRVYAHPDRGTPDDYDDYDATAAGVGQDGSLVLTRVDMRKVFDPGNLAAPARVEMSNPQLVRIIAAGLWGHVENLDLKERDEAPADDPR